MKSENVYYAVIVLYNKSVKDSITLNNLKLIKKYDIRKIVVDNSTINNNNSEICKENGLIYIDMQGNSGLSKAYNKVLDYLKEQDGIVIWFDDDTDITEEYFDMLDSESKIKKEVSIFVPIIRGQDGKYWSPNSARFFKNKQLNCIQSQIDDKVFNAINSCTAVRLDIYKNYRYDERLFLDQVDHNFFYDMRKRNVKFSKMETVINHNFSMKNTLTSIENLKKRYEIMIPDFLVYSSKTKLMLILGMIKVWGWGVREAKKYKDYKFIFWSMKIGIQSIKNKNLFTFIGES